MTKQATDEVDLDKSLEDPEKLQTKKTGRRFMRSLIMNNSNNAVAFDKINALREGKNDKIGN